MRYYTLSSRVYDPDIALLISNLQFPNLHHQEHLFNLLRYYPHILNLSKHEGCFFALFDKLRVHGFMCFASFLGVFKFRRPRQLALACLKSCVGSSFMAIPLELWSFGTEAAIPRPNSFPPTTNTHHPTPFIKISQ